MSLMTVSLLSSGLMMTVCICIIAKSFFKAKEEEINDYDFLEMMKEEHPEEYKDFLEEVGLNVEDEEIKQVNNSFWNGYILGGMMNDIYK